MSHLKNPHNLSLTPARVQYGALLVAGLFEMALIVQRATLRVETYTIVPALIFLGAVLGADKSRAAKRNLLVGIICVAWFCVVQEIHRTTEGEIRSFGLFAPAYLLAFPFASVYTGRQQQKGLRNFSYMYLAAILVVCIDTVVTLLNITPLSFVSTYGWIGTRLRATAYPTIMACSMMIPLAFCVAQAYRVKTWWAKGIYLLLAVAILLVQALTNGRTAILLTDAFVGGIVFFSHLGKGWKKALLGLAEAVILLVGLYAAATAVFNANTAAMQRNFYTAQTAAVDSAQSESSADEQTAEPDSAQTGASADKETASAENTTASTEASVSQQNAPSSGDRSLLKDLSTLTGRTEIWKGAISALKANPSILLFGVHDVYTTLNEWTRADHTHNSFLEILFWLGLPGLAMALYFTFLALRAGLRVLFGVAPMHRKCAALLCLCLLANGMLEPILFTGEFYYYDINFFFFLCLGYVCQWAEEMPKLGKKKELSAS